MIADGRLPVKYGDVKKVIEQLWRDHDPPMIGLERENNQV